MHIHHICEEAIASKSYWFMEISPLHNVIIRYVIVMSKAFLFSLCYMSSWIFVMEEL